MQSVTAREDTTTGYSPEDTAERTQLSFGTIAHRTSYNPLCFTLLLASRNLSEKSFSSLVGV